jgi:hypothetical protein
MPASHAMPYVDVRETHSSVSSYRLRVRGRSHVEPSRLAAATLWRDPHIRADAYRLGAETYSQIIELTCSTRVDAAPGRIKTTVAGNSGATPEIAAALAVRDNSGDTVLRDQWPF